MSYELLIGLFLGLIPLVVKGVNDLRANTHTEQIKVNEQALTFFKTHIDNLNQQVKTIEAGNTQLEQSYMKTREENAELRTENKFLNQKISLIECQLQEFTGKNLSGLNRIEVTKI